MKVNISFVVGISKQPDHRVDARLTKVFDVGWSGRPLPGEQLELDIGHPISEELFEFGGLHWSVEPSRTDGSIAWLWLKRIVVDPEAVEWEDGFQGYVKYAEHHGWTVFGGYGPLGRKTAAERDAAAT